jgi:integrase
MARQKTGSIVTKKGRLYARIRFIDNEGKKRDLWKSVSSKAEAKKKIKELIKENENKSSKELDASRMTFNQLVDYYQSTYLHEAVYINERKISGLRDIRPTLSELKALREHFGTRLIQQITHSEISRYKLERLKTPTKHKRQRTIASVNRELQRLRRILNIAVKEDWVKKSPFSNGDSLISMADETKRDRILSFEEEAKMLSLIDAEPKRKHLKGIVLIALDCALRRGEILTLCKKDCDFTNKAITIRAFNSKTARARKAGMTTRVYEWLYEYCQDFKDNEKLFPYVSFKTTWNKVTAQAKIDNIHFHDLRHTAITRLIRAGLPHTEVMRVSGHSTLSCFFRYVNSDDETVSRVANVLDSYLASNSLSNEISETVM